MKQGKVLSLLLLVSLALLSAACGSKPAASAPAGSAATAPAAENAVALPSAQEYVVGYEADEKQDVAGLLKACTETKLECVRGKDINDLVQKGVDAIISYSNQWHVLGAWPQIQNANKAAIPIFMLNADSSAQGVYNLSTAYRSTRAGLEWMMEEMGGQGDFVYFNYGKSNFIQDIIDEVLAKYPAVKAISMPAEFGSPAFTQASLVEMVKKNPNIRAIWSTDNRMEIFWGMHGLNEMKQLPLFLCDSRLDGLTGWNTWLQERPDLKSFATIPPGGTDYEAVYAALYHLSGLKFNPQALGGKWNNTFLYDYPIITSKNLAEWLGKLDGLPQGEFGFYRMPTMTPQEIRTRWFVG
jgi:ABC-type sugar transport system substrate-binding protein